MSDGPAYIQDFSLGAIKATILAYVVQAALDGQGFHEGVMVGYAPGKTAATGRATRQINAALAAEGEAMDDAVAAIDRIAAMTASST